MNGVNAYSRELTAEEISKKVHRGFVGGLWDEVGLLQLEFLLKAGLKPHHNLLDIGCGSLRGGVHYIRYLERNKYYGFDINASLVKAGEVEIREAGLSNKCPKLLIDNKFQLEKFNQKFDFMISVSLFTHLPMNIIIRCLAKVRENLTPDGVYYSTFFLAPNSSHLSTIDQSDGVVTNYDSDPFHYSTEELFYMAKLVGLNLRVVGNWGHPRNQKMAAFSLPSEPHE